MGVTNDLVGRIYKHKHHVFPGAFTAQYKIARLVYFETTSNSIAAIAREKQLKRWPRPRKLRLIELCNPEWRDLSIDWYEL